MVLLKEYNDISKLFENEKNIATVGTDLYRLHTGTRQCKLWHLSRF
jgi:hypothetical protein